MHKNIFYGVVLGIVAEIIYMISIYSTYPYGYAHIIFVLSALEGAIIYYIFLLYELNITFPINLLIYLLYIPLRIGTRIVGITLGTGLTLFIIEKINIPSLVAIVQNILAFTINLILLLIVFCAIFSIIRINQKKSKKNENVYDK
jgi:hypothetical protein